MTSPRHHSSSGCSPTMSASTASSAWRLEWMSERTAIRTGVTLAAAAIAWVLCAWLLARTSVPSLHLSGLDEHRYFSERALRRSARFSHGEQALRLAGTLATLGALGILAWRRPRTVEGMGLGRIGSAIAVGMALLSVLWAVGLPFGLFDLWWQHHWGLGPFDVAAWLDAQWATLGAEAVSAMLAIVVLVGLAGRFRYWWVLATIVFVAIAATFALVSGWLVASYTHPLRNPTLAADVRRIERVEGVSGTPVGVQD